jgi:hypothetical protein
MSGERLAQADQWLHEYTAQPHPDLGRDGVVCPYMVKALRRKYVTMVDFEAGRGDEALLTLARQLRAGLLARAEEIGSDRIYLVALAVPRGLPEPELKAMVGRAHAALKPEFVAQGLMVGDFWPEHETIGLHNDDFRPFTAPLSMLGMRHIVAADLNFFIKHEPTAQARLEQLEHYERNLGPRLNEYWSERLVEALDQTRRELAG